MPLIHTAAGKQTIRYVESAGKRGSKPPEPEPEQPQAKKFAAPIILTSRVDLHVDLTDQTATRTNRRKRETPSQDRVIVHALVV